MTTTTVTQELTGVGAERIRLFSSIREDVASVFERDPAAKNWFEVLLCYAGLHALWAYRVNHWLWDTAFAP